MPTIIRLAISTKQVCEFPATHTVVHFVLLLASWGPSENARSWWTFTPWHPSENAQLDASGPIPSSCAPDIRFLVFLPVHSWHWISCRYALRRSSTTMLWLRPAYSHSVIWQQARRLSQVSRREGREAKSEGWAASTDDVWQPWLWFPQNIYVVCKYCEILHNTNNNITTAFWVFHCISQCWSCFPILSWYQWHSGFIVQHQFADDMNRYPRDLPT